LFIGWFLQWAAKSDKNLELMKFLCEHSVDVNASDPRTVRQPCTPLAIAISSQQIEMVFPSLLQIIQWHFVL
jgi:hypothetical protein